MPMRLSEEYAEVTWTVDDIQEVVDRTLSRESARQFLTECKREIQDTIISQSWGILETILHRWKQEKKIPI